MTSASARIFFRKLKRFAAEKFSSVFDRILYLLRWPVRKVHADPGKKLLVFVGEQLPPRIPRMAKWLRRSGEFETLLLCHRDGFVEQFAGRDFTAIQLFRNEWHLRRLLRSLPPVYIVHGFAPKSRYGNVARKAVSCPYVHDMQDVYATYYGLNPSKRWLQQELPHERECLEKADGIIAHSLEANPAMRLYGIRPKPPVLFFPLYCDDDCFVENPEKISATETHIVYAGGVAGSHRDPSHYGNIQFFGLIETLTRQGFHFHIYPSPSNVKEDYEEYEQLAKKNPLFRFHEPASQDKLAGELARYHIGILPFFKELSDQAALKLKFATTLKLFNYLEAGLPILVSEDLGYQSWIVDRYGCGIKINYRQIPDTSAIITLEKIGELHKNVLAQRALLSLRFNMIRLNRFYNQLKK